MTLAEELEEMGYADGFNTFEEMVLDEFTSNFPAWSDEVLLQHPRQAIRLCKLILAKAPLAGTQEEREFFILRVLVNNRKNKQRRNRKPVEV